MSNISTGYGSKTTMTFTLTSLSTTTGRASTVVDNTSTKYLDSRVQVMTAGVAGSTLFSDVYVYTGMGDTIYADAATGTDASFASNARRNSRYLGSVQMNSASTVWAELPAVASAFGGVMPDKWGLILLNNSGATLSASAADHGVWYQGVYAISG